jgi:hypothetical protein
MDTVHPEAAPPADVPKHVHNHEWNWDKFNSRRYFFDNYRKVGDDDRRIVEIVRDFFADAKLPSDAHAVDVGAGANLYPSLAMLPFCAKLDLLEFSRSNIRWLRRRRGWLRGWLWTKLDRSWNRFWRVYAENPRYWDYAPGRAPLGDFRRKAVVQKADVFELPKGEYHLGTMFFVACSLSTELTDFNEAVERFVRSLKPHAPFAAAFMTGSTGYEVAGRRFPAVRIYEADVSRSLEGIAYDVKAQEIRCRHPHRPGVNMVIVTGRASKL